MAFTHRHHLGAYRREGDSYLIEIKLRDVRQLFNTLDPSPFHEKDLDPAAEEYLVSAVREIGPNLCQLILYLPAGSGPHEGRALSSAIRHYFTYRARLAKQQLRLLLGRGLVSLAIGSLFLFACLSLRRLFTMLGESAGAEILAEGLLILGWVAMWRPVEIFLYDWWPELGKHRLFARIADMKIEARPIASSATAKSYDPSTDSDEVVRLSPSP
jgi:hypothetical protein